MITLHVEISLIFSYKNSILCSNYFNLSIIQGESLARRPKLLSIKNYVIEIMA